MTPTLEKHRDLWTNSYSYWWSMDNRVISPYFDSEEEAKRWYETTWDNWKANK